MWYKNVEHSSKKHFKIIKDKFNAAYNGHATWSKKGCTARNWSIREGYMINLSERSSTQRQGGPGLYIWNAPTTLEAIELWLHCNLSTIKKKKRIISIAELTFANNRKQHRDQRQAGWDNRYILKAHKSLAENIFAESHRRDGSETYTKGQKVAEMVIDKVAASRTLPDSIAKLVESKIRKAVKVTTVENPRNIDNRLSVPSSSPCPCFMRWRFNGWLLAGKETKKTY